MGKLQLQNKKKRGGGKQELGNRLKDQFNRRLTGTTFHSTFTQKEIDKLVCSNPVIHHSSKTSPYVKAHKRKCSDLT
jgi:hypothetical protein